ncbi:hypothetical protein [Aquimarina aquimarini]|uniref:hypothetical protein n=1 Tax=Aquimarina aquimarini TaxID=1191734 RepID=UPI000D551151|nr:hypothetical protein [Aquimarina aquimarini]
MKNNKHFIALFYVVLFLLFKVAGLHAISHHGEDLDVQHCEICNIATTANFKPLLQTESPVLPKTEYFFLETKFNNKFQYVVFNSRSLFSYLRRTRPPPKVA